MSTYKAIAIITWVINSDKSPQECLDYAKVQLDRLMDCHPEGEEYQNFCVQMDLAQMKGRNKLIHIGVLDIEEVLQYALLEESEREWVINDQIYKVKMNSDRYSVFLKNKSCVSCGLIGSKMILDINPADNCPHFNLYAEEAGRLVLMTKDHILAKSKGGTDTLDNYQVMCSICNNLKGAYSLNLNECQQLRQLFKNEEKLPRKQLRKLINTFREEIARRNNE